MSTHCLLPFVFASSLGLAGCIVSGGDVTPADPPPPPDPVPISDAEPEAAPDPDATFSSSVDVHDMIASMSAEQDEDGITVYAALLHDRFLADPDPNFLTLDAGDRLTASIGTATTTMKLHRDGKKARYVARFTSAARSMTIVIAFLRDRGRESAPYSTVTLGEPFQIVGSVPSALRRSDPLPLRISSAKRTLSIALEGSCVVDAAEPIAFDPAGRATFDTSHVELDRERPPAAGTTCDVSGHLRADTSGSVDSAFARGPLQMIYAVEGTQVRSFATRITL